MGSRDVVGGDDSFAIMHNMIVKDKDEEVRQGLKFQDTNDHMQLPEQNQMTFEDFLSRFAVGELMSSFKII